MIYDMVDQSHHRCSTNELGITLKQYDLSYGRSV